MKRIFVVGCPRSGTTLVQSLIAAGQGMTSFTESFFFRRQFLPVGFGKYCLRKKAQPRVVRFLNENGMESLKTECSDIPDQFGYPSLAQEAGHRFIMLLDEMAQNRSATGWIEKTPDHLFVLSLIEQMASDARFVHIVREPMATIKSLYQAGRRWGKARNRFAIALKWWICIRISKHFRLRENHYLVFYEDVINQSKVSARRLFKWLEIPWDEGVLERSQLVAKSLINPGETWKAKNLKKIQKISKSENTEFSLPKPLLRRLEKSYEKIRQLCNNSE